MSFVKDLKKYWYSRTAVHQIVFIPLRWWACRQLLFRCWSRQLPSWLTTCMETSSLQPGSSCSVWTNIWPLLRVSQPSGCASLICGSPLEVPFRVYKRPWLLVCKTFCPRYSYFLPSLIIYLSSSPFPLLPLFNLPLSCPFHLCFSCPLYPNFFISFSPHSSPLLPSLNPLQLPCSFCVR